MNIKCKCGNRIFDNSDGNSDKAWFIPDKNWDIFWNEIYDAVVNTVGTKAEKIHAVNMIGRTTPYSAYRTMYQCDACGRVHIFNENGTFEIFEPESENTSKSVLNTSAIYSYNSEKIFKK